MKTRSSPRATVRRTSPNPIRLHAKQVPVFRALVWRHYRRSGRHALPWRRTRNPYRIAVSEIMLQQTRVARVLRFYPKFLKRFPSFRALARAPRREVLAAWQGMGYNRRAVALHRLAGEIIIRHRGKLPRDPARLARLPGIGPATAGAVAAFAFDIPSPFLETNIRRAIIHHFFPRRAEVRERDLFAVAARILDRTRPRAWHYALMDYGSWLATQTKNPNRRSARYRRQPPFKGSSRELRGKIVREFLARSSMAPRALARALGVPLPRVRRAFADLKEEGLVT